MRGPSIQPVLGAVGVLGEHVDDVHAEAVDPAVEPPAHHRVDRLADLRVLPVEVGHRAREQVQVVLAGGLVELPRRAGEVRAPVVGRARASQYQSRFGLSRLERDSTNHGVLRGGVVDHEVHHELHPALVDRREQAVEVRERAERRLDVLVVGDVVAVVLLRRGVDRRQPDHVDAEPREVVEARLDAPAGRRSRRRRSPRTSAGRSGRRPRVFHHGSRRLGALHLGEPLVQALAHLVGLELGVRAAAARDDDAGGGHARDARRRPAASSSSVAWLA